MAKSRYYFLIACYIQRLFSTVKCSAQVMLQKLVPIDWLDHPHYQTLALAWTDTEKPTTLLFTVFANALIRNLGSWSVTFPTHDWGVRTITITALVSWPISVFWAFQKEGLCRNQREKNWGAAILYSMWKIMWKIWKWSDRCCLLIAAITTVSFDFMVTLKLLFVKLVV